MTPLFDTFVAVDWSAAARPTTGRDSIWIAWGAVDGWRPASVPAGEPVNPATRLAATSLLRSLLVEAVAGGRRVLVGTDFPHGYPAGAVAAFGLMGPGASWSRLWAHLDDHLHDGPDNANDRFVVAEDLGGRVGGDAPGPFWGRPATIRAPGVPPRRAHTFPYQGLTEWRAVEARLRAAGWRPTSVWQLAYVGSVGSQALTGIPRLQQLRRDPALRDVTLIWPFETDFARGIPASGPLIVHTEAWPRLAQDWIRRDPVPDRAQVRGVVDWLLEAARAEDLPRLVSAPPDLEAVPRAVAVAEEGWVLGAP